MYLETYTGNFLFADRKTINNMTRSELIEHLEARGIACYDDESTSELRQCALEDLEGEMN
jgi:hypothetical protein